MEKQYQYPEFQVIKQDETNKIFFAASTGGADSVGGKLTSITGIKTGSWE